MPDALHSTLHGTPHVWALSDATGTVLGTHPDDPRMAAAMALMDRDPAALRAFDALCIAYPYRTQFVSHRYTLQRMPLGVPALVAVVETAVRFEVARTAHHVAEETGAVTQDVVDEVVHRDNALRTATQAYIDWTKSVGGHAAARAQRQAPPPAGLVAGMALRAAGHPHVQEPPPAAEHEAGG